MAPPLASDAFRILPDPFGEGLILEVHGAEQSHVNLEDPWVIRHEYARRIAHVCDALWPELQPLTVLHLGAGALTLPRYVAATRPGSVQVAVDIEPGLLDAVVGAMPLPFGSNVDCVTDDARAALTRFRSEGRRFHAIILDVFAGVGHSPAHLACEAFYRECLNSLEADGVVLINVGDDDGQAFLHTQIAELTRAFGSAPLMLCDSRVHSDRVAGNTVLAAGPGLSNASVGPLIPALKARGPHPAHVGWAKQ